MCSSDLACEASNGRRAGALPHLLLQPAWENSRGLALAIAHVKAHPAWRLSLQSHKWLGVR